MSHHPPAAAHHAESKHGWTLRQEIKITSKFRGKYLSIMPLGECSPGGSCQAFWEGLVDERGWQQSSTSDPHLGPDPGSLLWKATWKDSPLFLLSTTKGLFFVHVAELVHLVHPSFRHLFLECLLPSAVSQV